MLNEKGLFNFDLKISNDLEFLTSKGNAFQSLGAAKVNDLSPSVTLDLNLGCLSKRVSRASQVIA